MNPLLSTAPDDFVTPRPATHWVDTNVMLEVYSQGDFYAEHLRMNGDPAARWRKIQGSLWMAMALSAQHAVSRSYHYENQRN